MAWIILGSVVGSTSFGSIPWPRVMLKRSFSSEAKDETDVLHETRSDDGKGRASLLGIGRCVLPPRDDLRSHKDRSLGVFGLALYADAGIRGGPIIPLADCPLSVTGAC